MKSEMIKEFTHLGSAWYGAAAKSPETVDEISLTIREKDGKRGYKGEVMIFWRLLQGQPSMPQLEVAGDMWEILPLIGDLFKALSKADPTISSYGVIDILKTLGYTDKTERTRRN